MKKLLSLFAFSFLAQTLGATDLYVNSSGQSGTYTTITTALAVASTGDRIFVSTANFYNEDLNITKSVTIAPLNNTSKISLAGTIYIQPAASMVVNLIGIEMQGLALSTVPGSSTTSSPATFNILSCKVEDGTNNSWVDFSNNTIRLKIFDSDFDNILCRQINIAKSLVRNNLRVDLNVGQTPNDTIKIIACHLGGLQYASKDYHLFASNCMVMSSIDINAIPDYQHPGASVIQNCYIVNDMYYALNPQYTLNYSKLTVANCRLGSWYSRYYYTMQSGSTTYSPLYTTSADQNAYACTNCPYSWTNSAIVNASRSPNFLYNSANPNSATNWPRENLTGITFEDLKSSVLFNGGGGTWAANPGENPWNEAYIQNFTNISVWNNTGHPGSKYMDIDLTRNDKSILGGPYSWLNYWYSDAPGKAAVFDLNFPSEIWPGQTVNLKAEGVHTN